jgi:SP family facilitated glucose transporter-like MFS transporter 1
MFLMLFIICFEFSLGPLLWIYMSEIMTDKGLSLGVGVNWITTCFIGFFTKSLIDAFGGEDKGSGRLFLGCGGITALCGFFVLFVLKETKGLTDQEVANLYSKEPDVKIERSSYAQLDETKE